jgi:hypothetical protein
MPKKKRPKAVMVEGIPIEPISPAEHRRLERRIIEEVRKAAATFNPAVLAISIDGVNRRS